ncbi:hypothetical protein MBOT_40430 [Mycobacterium botniense]|uniref:Uncharacterized protein n=1 Tax=Mycobacterium botniense TaxID=84962 RepID=A0A7I9Y3P0_9MYCO|nr:hypothetical protein MBOT_40430 [Mycobacterium botniense]
MPHSLRARLSQASPRVCSVRLRSELMVDMVGVEQRERCVGLHIGVAPGPTAAGAI